LKVKLEEDHEQVAPPAKKARGSRGTVGVPILAKVKVEESSAEQVAPPAKQARKRSTAVRRS
jgi:hypothetical protein